MMIDNCDGSKVFGLLLVFMFIKITICEDSLWRLRHLMDFEQSTRHRLESDMKERESYTTFLQSHLLQLIFQRSPDDRLNLECPLSALVIVRRLVEHWFPVVATVKHDQGTFTKSIMHLRWPSHEDVKAAAKALMNVQITYNLNIDDLAHGFYIEKFVTNVTAIDCFRISNAYYRSKYFSESALWLQQALRKISVGDFSISSQEVLLYLIPTLCYSGSTEKAKGTMLDLLISKYPTVVSVVGVGRGHFAFNCNAFPKNFTENEHNVLMEVIQEEHKLCRERIKVPDGLRCRYVHYHQPHLRFQPFKLEELHLDPPVLRFYDAITDSEAENYKNITLQIMSPARAVSTADGSVVISDYRASFVGWVPPLNRLSRRIGDMARLHPDYTEIYQVASYALGGGVQPHMDYGFTTPFQFSRLATLMFYMNDVKAGGNTVFLNWNLSVPPVKNSAILWFNYLPDGRQDFFSYHSGCPVLQGRKWVLNIWIANLAAMQCSTADTGSFKGYYL